MTLVHAKGFPDFPIIVLIIGMLWLKYRDRFDYDADRLTLRYRRRR